MGYPWTREDFKKLKEMYPSKSKLEILKAFEEKRTWEAIKRKACDLQIKRIISSKNPHHGTHREFWDLIEELKEKEIQRPRISNLPGYWTSLRKKKREEVVKLLGNKCQICNFKECPEILEFHEIDGSNEGRSRNWWLSSTKLRKKIEEGKVLLVCPNCHRKIDKGLVVIN